MDVILAEPGDRAEVRTDPDHPAVAVREVLVSEAPTPAAVFFGQSLPAARGPRTPPLFEVAL